jgi:hypothetical protein
VVKTLLVGRSRDRFPVVSLGIFFPWLPPTEPCALRSTQPLKVPGISPGVKAAGVVKCSEGLNRMSNIIRGCIGHRTFAAFVIVYMVVRFVCFCLIL